MPAVPEHLLPGGRARTHRACLSGPVRAFAAFDLLTGTPASSSLPASGMPHCSATGRPTRSSWTSPEVPHGSTSTTYGGTCAPTSSTSAAPVTLRSGHRHPGGRPDRRPQAPRNARRLPRRLSGRSGRPPVVHRVARSRHAAPARPRKPTSSWTRAPGRSEGGKDGFQSVNSASRTGIQSRADRMPSSRDSFGFHPSSSAARSLLV